MPVYMCRWVNGDVSFVSAPSKEAAVALLDEVANAEGCPLFVVKDFMVHLRLKDEGKLELEEIGEETYHQIMEKAYPVLGSLPLGLEGTPDDAVKAAVETERNRVQLRPAPEPATEVGRQLKKELDIPTVEIDRIVGVAAKEVLKKHKSKGKPN